MRKLSPGDYHETNWKNGSGKTAQLAVFPAGAGLDDFSWRISMASVERDGDFSVFQGIDRSLVVLSGNGITLSVGGAEHIIKPGDAPFCFDGDLAASVRLIDGPVTDFNVMTRRGIVWHEVTRLGVGDMVAADHLRAMFSPKSALLEIDRETFSFGRWEALVDIVAVKVGVVTGEVLATFIR